MEGLMMEGRSRVTACVLLMFVSMVIADSPAAVWPLEAPDLPNESSVEVLRNAFSSSSGFSLSPSLDPSKATENYNHNVNTGSGVGNTPRGSSRQPRQLNSPVPTSHNVPLSWSAISPAPQISQTTGSSVPSSLPSVGEDSPDEPPVPSPQTQYGTVGVSDSEVPFGDRLEPSSKIQDLQLQTSHDPNIQLGYQQLESSHVVFVHHQMTSVSVEPTMEPTMGPPEDLFPTNTMDVEYGSGDYLETMSFMGSEGNDYSLVSNLVTDVYDFEDSNSETYDTKFPTRMVMSFSSKHLYPSSISVTNSFSRKPVESSSFNSNSTLNGATTDLTKHVTTFQSLPIFPTTSDVLNQNQSVNETSELAFDWPGTVTVQPTDVLLPDMNSLEYYTIQLTKDNGSLPEHTANQTTSSVFSFIPIGTTHIESTRTYTIDPSYMLTALFDEDLQPTGNSSWTEESSTDISGFEPFNTTILDPSEVGPNLTDTTLPYLEPSFIPTIDPSTSLGDINSTTDWATTPYIPYNTSLLVTTPPPVTKEPDGMSSVNNSQWIITSLPTETLFPSSVFPTVLVTSFISVSENSTDSTFNITSTPSATVMADEGFVSGTTPDTMVTDSDNTTLISSLTTTSSPVLHNDTTVAPFTISSSNNTTVTTLNDTSVTTQFTTLPTTTARKYICNITKPDTYLIRVGFPPGSTAGYAKAKVREILKAEYNRSVELQVLKAPPDFVFRAVSGAVVYTAISVINALTISARTTSSFISVSPISPIPGLQFHVHTVLQFVPSHVDVRMCTFSEQAEKGLITALSEVRRRSQESTNFTVNILNITTSSVEVAAQQQKVPVEITFAVRDMRGYVPGTEVSAQLRQLSVVEYSYYLGYPVRQIAEPFHYPELNTTQLLRSSWVRTVLLGVLDQPVSDKIFKATIERRLAQLLGDALGMGRRFRRATSVGNNSVQVFHLLITEIHTSNPEVNDSCQEQRLQTPSVKGFDFAKLHMGQHSKDDLMVIQEPLPLPVAAKEQSPAENAEVPTPKSKASRNGQRRRGQISPSEGDSIGSDPPSDRGSPEEGMRTSGLPTDPKQPRKIAANGLNGPPPMNGMDEPLSSASIFEHVDRMSRPTDGPKRPPNKIQLIAMQPMPALPLPSPTANDRAAENAKLNKEIQVALRHKSEIEHHRNKIRLRAKRKGHYDFPAMDDLIDGLGDPKEQDQIYQKAQMQIDKILDPDIHMPSLYTEPKKRGKHSPKLRRKQQLNGDLTDKLITADSDGTYRKYPGINNIAYVSDPDQGPEHHSPSQTDDVFHGPISPPPPPPYLPPQPSIEEARQQMHSLLDDAFALVSPSSQGSTAGITLPGVGLNPGPPPASSPPSRGPRPWGPGYLPLNPYTGRYAELGLPPSSAQGLLHRQGFGPGYIPSGEALPVEQLQPESLYAGRGGHTDDLPSSARPRPVGGTTGAQLHHSTHAGLTGRVGDSRQPGGLNWSPYHEDNNKLANNREPTSRNGLKEPSAAPAHLDTLGLGYAPSAPLEEPSPPNHSSASLIKAIREELMRLSQKQAAVPSYHS
uniref:Si:ch211-1e14.1 n=1 Tax=Cyprinus carpio TaxID=7962 RepID=A0A8C1ZZK7_CYPCA